MIEILACVAVCVSVVALAIAQVSMARRCSNAIAQVMAAAAESNRQFMVYSEKAVNRTMAAANPLNFRSMREVSGTIEGAQAPVEGHYEKPAGRAKKAPIQVMPAPPRQESDNLNGVYESPRNVGSTLEFEDDGGNR